MELWKFVYMTSSGLTELYVGSHNLREAVDALPNDIDPHRCERMALNESVIIASQPVPGTSK